MPRSMRWRAASTATSAPASRRGTAPPWGAAWHRSSCSSSGPVVGLIVPGRAIFWIVPAAVAAVALVLAWVARVRRLPVEALELLSLGAEGLRAGAPAPRAGGLCAADGSNRPREPVGAVTRRCRSRGGHVAKRGRALGGRLPRQAAHAPAALGGARAAPPERALDPRSRRPAHRVGVGCCPPRPAGAPSSATRSRPT